MNQKIIDLDQLIKNLIQHNTRPKDVYICVYINEVETYIPIELGGVSTYGDGVVIFINKKS